MGDLYILKQKYKPWWEKTNTELKGDIFNRFILRSDDPEEQRVQKLREKILGFSEGEISTERARLVTESYKKTEGEHPGIRKAKAFYHVMENINIDFLDDELIVGNPNSGFGKVEIDPEYMSDWLNEKIQTDYGKITELRALNKRKYNRLKTNEEDIVFLENEIFPYWKDKTLQSYVKKTLRKKNPEALDFIDNACVSKPVWGKGYSHTIQDYNSILRFGLGGFKKKINNNLKNLKKDESKRKKFYESMLICIDAVLIYANRCSDKAADLANNIDDEKRKKELLKIADICAKVPNKPAEDLWEALQSLCFMHAATFLAEGGVSHAMGRLDQYLLLYLNNSLEKDMSEKKAQELLECFFLKFFEFQTIRDYKSTRGLGGDRTNDKITISGVDENGLDVTNKLSYMILEGFAHVHLKEPNISVRFHKHSSRRFMMDVLEIVRLGSGMPVPLNDDVIIPSLTGVCGVSLKDARNYADLGCQENIIDPNTAIHCDCNGHNNAGWFNLPKIVEITLNNGINPLNNVQVGPKTGDPKKFKTMDEFLDALEKQMKYAIEMNVIANQAVEDCFYKYYPTVFHNLMHPNTCKNGTDYNNGGCKYNWIGSIGVGIANAADSLCSIDQGIYKNKDFTWDELLISLKNNWKKNERIRQRCISYPKYGCDNPIADMWMKKITNMFFNIYENYQTKRDARFVCGLFTMGMYLILGENVGATPDGRLSYEMLANSVSGSRYMPKTSLTATHKSAAKIDTYRTPNGLTFNQILSKSIVNSKRDIAKWADLLRTYFDYGGQTVQYSIVSKEEMLKAQKKPDDYKNLIVRVGGYSAVFTDLTKEIQDDIIERSYEWH